VGLDENWITFTGLTGHVEREAMSPEEVAETLLRINQENGDSATCQFILQGNGHRLTLSLNRGTLTVSDPAKANYQNVALQLTELGAFLQQFFAGKPAHVAAFPEEVRQSHLHLLEGIIALVAVVVFGITVYFVSRYMKNESGFIPMPEVTEIGSGPDAKQHLVRYAGVYATRIGDGEMVLELKEDGSWGYYDMFKSQSGSFDLQMVEEGTCRPVLEQARMALLADNHYLFYPAENGRMVFQQRRYSRIGNTRDDLPFLKFAKKPPMASG